MPKGKHEGGGNHGELLTLFHPLWVPNVKKEPFPFDCNCFQIIGLFPQLLATLLTYIPTFLSKPGSGCCFSWGLLFLRIIAAIFAIYFPQIGPFLELEVWSSFPQVIIGVAVH